MKEKKQKRGVEKIIPFRPQIKKVTNGIKTVIVSINLGFNPNEPNFFTIA